MRNEWQMIKTKRRLVFGSRIVADPRICHGKLTFNGTRVFVAQVLEQVAKGRRWESIARIVAWLG